MSQTNRTGAPPKSKPVFRKAGRPRSQAVDQAILGAALRLARQKGYANVTIDGIALASGVGKPSIYRRWSSKAEIVTEALSRQAEKDVQVPTRGSFRDILFKTLQNVARQLRESDGIIVCSLFAEAQLSKTYRPIFQGFIRRRRRRVRDLIASAISCGALSQNLDLELALDEIYGPILVRMLVGYSEIDDTFIRAHLHHLFTGFTTLVSQPAPVRHKTG